MKFTSPIFSAASGSIAGTVFSHNRGGLYTRARSIPTNPNTARQQAVRSYLGQAVSAWLEELDPEERQSWTNWANQIPYVNSLGKTYFLTGQQAYIRSYIAAAMAEIEPPNDMSSTPPDNGNGIMNVQGGASDATEIQLASGGLSMLTDLELMSGGASAAGVAQIFLGPPVSVGRNFWKGPYQLAVSLPVIANQGLINWTTTITELTNSNGAPTDGQRRPLKARIVYVDGRVSQEYREVLPVTVQEE